MTEQNQQYQGVFDRLSAWLDKAAPDEMHSIRQWVNKAEEFIDAAADVSVNEYQLSVDSFKNDLLGFYRHYQQDAEESLYLDAVQEGMWQHLANMTDTTQVEWQEFLDDIDHDGVYRSGDVIGFGRLSCNGCGRVVDITHASTVIDCPKCGHNTYSRQLFKRNV
ncbi:zinc ribbon-containing protein [Thalassotalea maritima]|uniref:zinc ribbon-containing protein n=1 Tax=Thalassotalea maritima TaxID=3242416 RepID=UPI003527B30D